MKTKVTIHSKDETRLFAQKLAQHIEVPFLITMSGDLGAGKTTFTKALGEALGIKRTINSPTFTILKSYKGDVPLYHIDAYRLEGLHQELGFEEIFEEDAVCVVEWSSFIKEQLPKDSLHIAIEMLEGEARSFILEPHGEKYEKLLEELL